MLAYLMENCDRIIPSSKLRSQLWDIDEEPISNVVAAQIRLLRRKFDRYNCDCPYRNSAGAGVSL